nr:MAG TPA: hypothetical protein [Caudoviricetes sp.]
MPERSLLRSNILSRAQGIIIKKGVCEGTFLMIRYLLS